MIYPLLNSLYKSLETQTQCLLTRKHWSKKENQKRKEKDQRLGIIEEAITQLSLKKSSREKAIKEYHAESDKYAFDAEKRRI